MSKFLALLLAPAVLAQDCSLPGATTIAGLAAVVPSLSTLLAAVQNASPAIAAALSSDGALTVFAPTNDAFAALGQDTIDAVLANNELLDSILLKHVIGSGRVPEAVALTLKDTSVETLSGESITVDGSTGNVLVTPTILGGAATVVQADANACNGVVHIIDKVIAPDALVAPDGSASKDPHLHFAHGGRADLRGEDGGIYNFLSAHNVSMNMKTVKADFHWKDQLVHGTRIGAVYWTIKALDGATITVKFESTEDSLPKAAFVSVNGHNKATVSVNEEFSHQGVHVALTSVGLKVSNARWVMSAKAAHFPFAKSNKKKYLLDIEAAALYNADADPVAPHGIFGQSFDGDGLAVDGARDGDTAGAKERTTSAQAEGAIEGTVADYKMSGAFATDFKFSRFNGVPAPHRDVSKLTGKKHAAAKAAKAAVASNDDPADGENKATVA